MIDKLKLWADMAIVGGCYSMLTNYLDCGKEETDIKTGEIRTYGTIEGLKVAIYTGGLSIVGSMPKFLYGSNVYTLDRHKIEQAIEKISDTLHIQTEKAKVTEMEFGTNFMMKYPVADYLTMLGAMPRLNRVQATLNSLRYEGMGKHKPKIYTFYDKIAEADAKGMDYPSNMQGVNLLRYEMKFYGRLPQQLGVPEVTASTLSEKEFYRMMVKRYQDIYFLISKQNRIKTNAMMEIRTVDDAVKVLFARLINQTGQEQISEYLKELKEVCVFEDRKNYTRLKKKLEDIATNANFTISDELIKELDDEIKNCGAYI